MPTVTFLHTADVHVETFDRLMHEIAPGFSGTHVVRAEWLSEARERGIGEDLKARVLNFLREAGEKTDAVLCSCSTLGPLADEARSAQSNIVRIDRPMMEKAVALDGTIVVAFCLESTREPTMELIRSAAGQLSRPGRATGVLCDGAWDFFERGDSAGFGRSIATSIRSALDAVDDPSCIVLAQASMAVAEPYLSDLDIPVLSSPRLAMEAVLELAAQ